LFGATSQTLASLASAVSHSGEGFTADLGVKFRYGESEDANRLKFVSSRSWAANISLDGTPNGRFSPFMLANAESSLEKRIDGRFSGGGGAKWIFAKSTTGSASASAAVLAERTVATNDTVPATTLVRWSWRVKLDQRVDDKVSFSHSTFYGPVFSAPGRYTITSTSVGSYAMSKAVAFTLTFVDNYDSQAKTRGAPTNNDGSFLFGIRGAF
jgi:hypothetical protein